MLEAETREGTGLDSSLQREHLISFVTPLLVTTSIGRVAVSLLLRVRLVGKFIAVRRPRRSCFCTLDSKADVFIAHIRQLALLSFCLPNSPKGKMCSSCSGSSPVGRARQ